MQQHIQGTVTSAENHHYLSHQFVVPEGASRLDIDFEYSPKRTGQFGNLLTLSLYDPNVERGTGHRGQPTQHITLSTGEATPGYTPGPLPPGTWNILINCNLINPGAPVDYHFDITISSEAQPAPVTWKRGATQPRGAGWYRGDLHGHTIHSDGQWEAAGLVGFARLHQLDFITLTDHNTVSSLPQMDSLSSDDLLTMGGFELTTFYGHALALGIRQAVDWRVRGTRTMTDMRSEVEAAGGLFIIAHPACPGDPFCTGCHWEYSDVMPGPAALVEIWNEQWSSGSNNEGALELWYDWLNEGRRIYATVGTDIHGPADPALEFGFNVVYAQSRSEAAILDGVRHGHTYLSSGPRLEFTGRSAFGAQVISGDTIAGLGSQIAARWQACAADDRVRFILDGQVQEEFAANSAGDHNWALDLDNGHGHWCVVEVRAANGSLRAVTNPIFVS